MPSRPALFQSGERLRLDHGSRKDILRGNVSYGYEQSDMQVPPHFPKNGVHCGEES